MKSIQFAFIGQELFSMKLKPNATMKSPECVLICQAYLQNRTRIRFNNEVPTISVYVKSCLEKKSGKKFNNEVATIFVYGQRISFKCYWNQK